MKRVTITALSMVLVSVVLLFILDAAASRGEVEAVYDALIGAKNVQLAWGLMYRRTAQRRS